MLYVAGDTGLTVDQLFSITAISKDQIVRLIKRLTNQCRQDQDCPFWVLDVHGRYQLVTKKALNPDVQKYFRNTHTSILTSAALETLTIIAYNQPVTRIEVDSIRGVNSAVTIEKLLRQKLIKKSGRKKVLGNPIMYRTTDAFLDLFGLKDLKSLPKIKNKN